MTDMQGIIINNTSKLMNEWQDNTIKEMIEGSPRDKLLEKLRSLNSGDEEKDHIEADKALLEYINDTEITLAFEAIEKWYA